MNLKRYVRSTEERKKPLSGDDDDLRERGEWKMTYKGEPRVIEGQDARS